MPRKLTNTRKKAEPKAKVEAPIVANAELEEFLKVVQQTEEQIVSGEITEKVGETDEETKAPIQEDVEQLDEVDVDDETIEIDIEDTATVEVVPPQIVQPKVEKKPTPPKKEEKEEKPYVKVKPVRKLYTGSVMGIEGLYGY